MNFVSEYIKYLFNAKGRHGIHSPFVYEFIDKCLRVKPDPAFKITAKILRNNLSRDKTEFKAEDFGAGSRKLGQNRSVRSVYKTASCKGVYADLLYQLTCFYQPKTILELGTSLGLGTIYLAKGNENAAVISVEACKNTVALAKKNIEFAGLKNTELIHDTFESYLQNVQDKSFDLVYIDGHHEGRALKKYLGLLEKHTHENTIFVLDDIRWNDDMFTAWKVLSGSETYHLSMDLFRMGILIRRPQQVKENFTIKLKNVLSGF